MSRLPGVLSAVEPFGEKDFYLEEFRGRSVLIAVAPAVAAQRTDLGPLARTTADLVRNGTRVIVWWPATGVAAERRMLTALARGRAWVRGRGVRKRPQPLVRQLEPTLDDPGRASALRADLWECLRRGGLCVLAVRDGADFPLAPMSLATALRVPKVVVVDALGGLTAGGSSRLSFVDENMLDTLLQQGQAEWSGLGDRVALLTAIRDAVDAGVESVNLCTPDDVAEELFSYEGSGTLFTQGDYCRVGPLGLDDFAQAERLLERGQREGLLKLRSPEEIAEVLAAGFGATICGRHLAGVAGLLTEPYAAERTGEIVGLYTIMRFKGEGIGERLVRRVLDEAAARGIDSVFACAVDERAQLFFERQGFTRVPQSRVPALKWKGYDARRRARVGVFRRTLPEAAL
jgi:amino-acid N-acetyltransferase